MEINGKKIARDIISELGKRSAPKKFLAVFLVGDDPASESFVEQKERTAKELGVDFRIYRFPADISQNELRQEIGKTASHKTCGGALVQLPLPKHINRHYVLNAIPREKDVDVLGERALGAFYTGRNPVIPPPVAATKLFLEKAGVDLADKKVAVVGLGLLIGKPIAHWLEGKVKELFLLDIKSDLAVLKQVDVIISGTGHAGLLKPELLKDGVGIIDFGYAQGPDGALLGDFDVRALEIGNWKLEISFYTPTPGGTGPVVVAELFQNFYTLNE